MGTSVRQWQLTNNRHKIGSLTPKTDEHRWPMYFSPRNAACSGIVNKGSSTILSRDARYCKKTRLRISFGERTHPNRRIWESTKKLPTSCAGGTWHRVVTRDSQHVTARERSFGGDRSSGRLKVFTNLWWSGTSWRVCTLVPCTVTFIGTWYGLGAVVPEKNMAMLHFLPRLK